MTITIQWSRSLRYARRGAALATLSILAGACSMRGHERRENVGEDHGAVVGIKDYCPASTDKGDAIIGPRPMKKTDPFKPLCTGSVSKWKDKKNSNKQMMTGTTAAHCLDYGEDLAMKLPNIDVDGKPALIELNTWKKSDQDLAVNGDVAISTFCGNLIKLDQAWQVVAAMIPKDSKVDVHGARQVKNPDHPKETKDGRWAKGDVKGPDDFQKVFALTEPMPEVGGRAGILASWMTRPGDSGSGGKVGGELAYVHSRYHPVLKASGTRVTEQYISDLWNGSIAAVEADGYDGSSDEPEPDSGDGGPWKKIGCSWTGIVKSAPWPWSPPPNGGPTVPIKTTATGTADDIGEFWDSPNLLIDTPYLYERGGIPPHSRIDWSFTPQPPDTNCDPNDPRIGCDPNPPAPRWRVRIIQFPMDWPADTDESPKILVDQCYLSSYTLDKVPTTSPAYRYTVEIVDCDPNGDDTASATSGPTSTTTTGAGGAGAGGAGAGGMGGAGGIDMSVSSSSGAFVP